MSFSFMLCSSDEGSSFRSVQFLFIFVPQNPAGKIVILDLVRFRLAEFIVVAESKFLCSPVVVE